VFPGQYHDAETGLSYNLMRDYDPRTGRYLQADGIGLAAGTSLYGYANQNPIMNYDPNGENTMVLVPVFLGAVAIALLYQQYLDVVLNGYGNPPGTGTWEDDLDWVDNGPKDETTECKNDDDEHCKKRLQMLRKYYSYVFFKKNTGMNTYLDEITYNSLAQSYHADCPYWVRVPLFDVSGASNDSGY